MSDRRVFKYSFDIADVVDVLMPPGAEILHVDVQDGVPCIWALVDPNKQPKPRRFYVRGTGHVVSDNLRWLATFQTMSPFVWHVFEGR